MVRHIAFKAEPAKPSIGQVEMHLFAEPALRTNAEAVTNEQHPDHQFRADRGAAGFAVIGLQIRADALEFDNPIDAAQQMIGRDMPLKVKLVEQRALPRMPLAHHGPTSAS